MNWRCFLVAALLAIGVTAESSAQTRERDFKFWETTLYAGTHTIGDHTDDSLVWPNVRITVGYYRVVNLLGISAGTIGDNTFEFDGKTYTIEQVALRTTGTVTATRPDGSASSVNLNNYSIRFTATGNLTSHPDVALLKLHIDSSSEGSEGKKRALQLYRLPDCGHCTQVFEQSSTALVRVFLDGDEATPIWLTRRVTNTDPTGLPTVETIGAPKIRETATVSTDLIADEDGMSDPKWAYEWILVDGETEEVIEGETEPTYLIREGDLGKKLKVRVTYYDDYGFDEVLTSTATGTIKGAARITEIDVPAPGNGDVFVNGETIRFDVTFSHAVSMFGVKNLKFTLGSDETLREAAYKRSRDADTLRFEYTVGDDDLDADGLSIAGSADNTSGPFSGTGIIATVIGSEKAELAYAGRANIADREVDGVRPEIRSAYVSSGTRITAIWSEQLATPTSTDGWTITVSTGTAPTVQNVAMGGTRAFLNLSGSIDANADVTLSYAPPSTEPIRDQVGNPAKPFTNRTVPNGTAEAPTVEEVRIKSTGSRCANRAYVKGDDIVIGVRFNQPVTIGGTPTITLRMCGYDLAVDYAQGATLYEKEFTHTVGDMDFSCDGQGPAITANTLSLDGGTIRSNVTSANANLEHDGAARAERRHMVGRHVYVAGLDGAPPEGKTYIIGERIGVALGYVSNTFSSLRSFTSTRFSLLVGGGETGNTRTREALMTDAGFSNIAFFGGYTVQEGDMDTDGVAIPRDALRFNGGSVSSSNINTRLIECNEPYAPNSKYKIDGIRPAVTEARVDGSTLTLDWSETLDSASLPAGSAFTIAVTEGTAPTVSTVGYANGAMTLTLSSAVAGNAETTLDYTPPTGAAATPVKDVPGNDAVAFSGRIVQNMGRAPAKVTGVSATAGFGAATVSWNTVSDADGYAILWWTGTDASLATTVAVSGGATTSATVAGLTPDIEHSVQVAAVKTGATRGEPSDTVKVTPKGAAITSVSIVSDPNADGRPGDDQTYAIGDKIVAEAIFDTPVDVGNAGGAPEIELTFPGATRAAAYESGSGTAALRFAYTVAEGDHASTVQIAAGAITHNFNTIRLAGTSHDADLSHGTASTTHKVDGGRPALLGARVDSAGTTIALVFNETLAGASAPAISAFSVTAGGATVRPGSLSFGLSTVTLADVTPAITVGQTVIVSYTDPSAGNDALALQDNVGNDVESFTTGEGGASAVINAVTTVVNSITFNSAGMDGAFKTGDAVTATVIFSGTVNVDTTGGTPQLTIDVGGSDKVLDYASGHGTAALVFSGYTVAANDEDTDGISIAANKLDANDGTIKAAAGATLDAVLTHAAVAASANHKVDGVKPTLVTTGSNAPRTSLDGSKIILTFSEAMGAVDRTKITVKKGTTTQTTTADSISGTKVEITLTVALLSTDTNVTVELAVDAVADAPGNGIAAVSATTVIRASAPGAPVLAAAAQTESIELTWTLADHGSSDITRFDYRIKETDGGTYPATWTDTGATASNTGGSLTIGSLTNGTQYSVQVRGVNGEGEGDPSNEAMATPDLPPAITTVAITSDPGADKTYIIGDALVVTVTFDKNITLSSGTGSNPTIAATIGSVDTMLTCSVPGTPPTMELACTTSIQHTEGEDSDGISLPGNTMQTSQIVIIGPLGQTANLAYSTVADDSDHKVDAVKPTLSSANATGDLSKIVLTFSEAIGTVDGTKITVKKGGTTQSTTDTSIDSTNTTKVEITLMTALLSTDTDVTVELDVDAVTDVPGNGIAAVSSTAVTLVDNTPPTLSSAGTYAIDGTGTGIALQFNETIASTSIPVTSAFAAKIAGTVVGVASVARDTTDADTVNLVLNANPKAGDSVTVSYTTPGSNPLEDEAGNDVASFTDAAVTNNNSAPGKPTVTVAAKDASLEVTVAFTAHGTHNIAKYQYQVKTTGSFGSWTDSTENVSNTGGTFTIGSLTNGTEHTIKVRGVSAAGDGAESDEASGTPQAPPAVSSVAITSTPTTANTYIIGEDIVVTVTFDKVITLGSGSHSPNMSVTVGSAFKQTDTCVIGTDTTTLVCTETVSSGDEDTNGISIGANALFEVDKRILGPLGQRANLDHSQLTDDSDHKVDGVKPTLSSAAASSDLTKVVLTFSEALTETPLAAAGDFTLNVDSGTAPTIDSVAIDGRDVTLSLSAAVDTSNTYTIDYTAGTNPIKDVPGNDAEDFSGQSVSLVDNTAPTFVSAGTNDTDEVVLTYSEALNTTAPATSAFAVKVGGNSRGVDTVAISGSAVTLTLASAFRPGDTLTVAYTKPGTNPIKDASSNANEADSLAETAVTNNLADTAPEAPGNFVVTATHADAVALAWTVPWDNGSPIEKHQHRYAEGSSVPPSTTWTDVPDSAPGEANATGGTVGGDDFKPGTQYAFEVRAVNGEGNGDEAAATATTLTPTWSFHLLPFISGAEKLTEGGASRDARLLISNDVRFSEDQTVTLKWGDDEIDSGLIQGANGSAAFTIDAGDRQGELEISAPDRPGDLYRPPETKTLTANLGGTQVGNGIELEFVDDEAKPVLSMSLSRTGGFTESLSRMTIVEDGVAFVQGTLSRGYDQTPHTIELPIEMTGSLNRFANASSSFSTIDGKQIHDLIFVASTAEQLASAIRAADGSTAGDHSEHVFTLLANDLYTMGTPSSATLIILDNDAVPTAPRNLRAQARDGAVVLTWDPPTSLATTEFTAYELRHVAGGSPGGTFADISTDPDTGTHTVTGLTNETEYTFELRAKNSFGSSGPVSVSRTPREGIAVSFGAGSVSIREGGTRTVAVTLSEAPAAGTTVTVPISATAGEGLDSGEYSGVPMNVVFAAGDTSKSFTVATVDDTDDEPDRRLLTFSFGTLPEGYVPGTHETFVLTILDDDDPPGTLKARRGDGEVHLEWVPLAAVPGNRDRAHQLRYGEEGGESGQWRDIPRSAPGGRNGRSYTVTGLENGTRYAFELRVRRGSGFGPAAEIRQTPEAARWSVSANRRSVHEGEDVTVGIATSNAVGFYSAPEPLTVAVIGQIEFPGTTIEGADPEDFEIWVDGARVRGYAKDITFFDYDAIPGNDPFPAQHFDLEVPVGSTSVDVTVRVLADGDEEDQETMSFMVFRGEEWVNSGPAWGQTGVNIEPSDAGVVKQLAVADAEATEGEDPSLDFVVTLAPAAEWEVTVDYATEDGTATAGADYTDTNGTLTFAPGETEKTVSVPVIDDAVEDTPETLALRLFNADPEYDRSSRAWGSEEAGVLIADAVATGTIRNTEDQADLSAEFPESAFASKRHTGSDDRPQVVVAFSEAVAEFAADTPSASVTGASGLSVQPHAEDGLENAYVFFMTPDGDGDVTFALTANAACAAGGICTAGGTALARVPTARTIPGPGGGPSSLSVADAEATEEGDGAMAFVVTLDPAARGTVTVDYATSDGSARAGDDYTATSGTLTFLAGETEKTISVPVADDAEDDGGETFALTLGDASGADVGDAEATGTIRDADATATPLTASFSGVPATHDGSGEFTFQVEFSEDVGIGYAVLRDDAFAVTKGDVTGARRVDGRNDLWEIAVEPDGRDDVAITLPGNRACGTTGALCTRGEDPRPLSNSPSATVAGPTAAPTVDIADAGGAEGDGDIAFAVTLDGAATDTVTVDYATANGSATAGDDYTASSGTLSFAAGETEKTVSVAIGDDVVNESDETFTVTLSNASGAVLGTASATGTIENRHVVPLTASFEQVPAEHDGTTFVFHARFSEDPAVSYLVLRDESFGVTGGEVVGARRKDGRDDLREIHVEPSGHGDVTVSLPPTTDCDARGAICTADGRPLSNANAATVRAMAALSAADAEATEGAGATLEFAVTLSRAASAAVTVDYATSDGTAVAGTDYTSASGTLTFDPGETAGTVSVAVLDDSVDDGGETLTLTLSNASGARIADATATGTIDNADPVPLAWLVRFGRAASDHAVEAIGARFEDDGGGAHATFAGRRLWGGGAETAGGDAFGADPWAGADDAFGFGDNGFGGNGFGGNGFGGNAPGGMNPRMNGGMGGGFGTNAGMQTGMDGGMGMNPGAGGGPHGGIGMDAGMSGGIGRGGGLGMNPMNGGAAPGVPGAGGYRPALRDLLIGSSFLLSAHGADEAGASRRLTAWGRAAATRFDGVADGVSVDGDVATFLVGADAAWNRWLAGISVAHTIGAGGFRGADGADGELDSALTAVHPYLRYRLSDRISAWGVLGYGTGDLTLETDGSAWETDTSMRMGAAGMRGVLLRGAGGLELAAKTDVRLTHIGADAAEGAAGLLGATAGATSRLRLLLEGSRPFAFGPMRTLTPTLELGVRRDGGDAETGMGVDLGGSLRYADAALGLTAKAGGRYLAAHEDAGYREWGASASIRIDPGVAGRGLTLSVAPSWGADAAGGAERLWSARDARALAGHGFDAAMRLRAEVGYGLPAFRGRGGVTPFAGLSTTAFGRDWRAGALWRRGPALEMALEATRGESAGARPAHGVLFRLTWRPGARERLPGAAGLGPHPGADCAADTSPDAERADGAAAVGPGAGTPSPAAPACAPAPARAAAR